MDAEFLLLKEEQKKDGDRCDEVAEKHLLHDGKVAREVDKEVHERKTQRRPQDEQDADRPFGSILLHISQYMPLPEKSQAKGKTGA